MNKKKILIMLTVSLVCFFLIIPSSWAGAKQRHRWEGAAMGIGAAFLGHALYNQYYSQYTPAPVYHKPPKRRPRGHWEHTKVWIPASYEKAWNPGHYNKKGRWVSGRWIKIEKEPGHWVKERIWVSKRSKRHR
jgi:hypothetical protein